MVQQLAEVDDGFGSVKAGIADFLFFVPVVPHDKVQEVIGGYDVGQKFSSALAT